MPPELVHLPSRAPLNLYDFACWARGTIAPLLIVLSRRPVHRLGFGVQELVAPGTEQSLHRVPGAGVFWWLDRLQKLYERLPRQPGRERARRELTAWIIDHQEADGSWGGIQPPWVYSLIALNLQGMGLEHPVMRRGLRGLRDRFAVSDAQGWRLQACMSPVWDTAWVVLALRAAGLPRAHPAVRSAAGWIVGERIERGGDWQVKVPLRECGGWAFEFDNDLYPDVDDTAIVVLALLEGGEGARVRAAAERGARWAEAMRSSNGAWGSFDKDNTRQLVYRIPFADFGAMLDPPSEDVTAHVLEMLAGLGRETGDPVVRGGLRYLAREQRPGGSWYGRWGVNHVYGTWCVISALSALRCGGPHLSRAVGWLLRVQNGDGGWGETCHSYEDESFAGVGVSTASQTAWAVMALQRGGHGGHPGLPAGPRLPPRAPAGRHLAGARVHRDRVPRRLLPQLRDVPPRLPHHGPGHGRKLRPVHRAERRAAGVPPRRHGDREAAGPAAACRAFDEHSGDSGEDGCRAVLREPRIRPGQGGLRDGDPAPPDRQGGRLPDAAAAASGSRPP